MVRHATMEANLSLVMSITTCIDLVIFPINSCSVEENRMPDLKEALVPDIGGYDNVPVIEVLVAVGDRIEKDQGLLTLESDKATMEVPAAFAGVVKELKVKVGDELSQGSVVAIIETDDASAKEGKAKKSEPAAEQKKSDATEQQTAAPETSKPAQASSSAGAVQEATVPDIGGYDDVPVIELLVAAGDRVSKDQGLITLESDKATMEVPAPFAGVIKELKVKVGDTLSQGDIVALIESEDAPAPAQTSAPTQQHAAKKAETQPAKSEAAAPAKTTSAQQASTATEQQQASGPAVRFNTDAVLPDKVPYATPAVRLFARELGVDLSVIKGSARGGRITREDVQGFVKDVMQKGGSASATMATGGGLNLLPWPQIDFSKFGETEVKPLTRIQKISGANLARNWVMIPHVTQHDSADITELEALRVQLNKENEKAGIKLTMLAFLMKASVVALKKFPTFNASIDAAGENLTLKKYFNIGFAADTPNGLVVPVVRDCDKKGIIDIAQETAELAKKARDGKLGPADMQGGCFSISSLGGIGGTSFTPIVNAPEVAILGVSKSSMQPVWDGKQFNPRLMLPLSLSYDHRVIDGAAAARFTAYLAQLLADMRRSLL